MIYLMRLAEALRDIAELSSQDEIDQALGLCAGFADRIHGDSSATAEVVLGPRVVAERRRGARTLHVVASEGTVRRQIPPAFSRMPSISVRSNAEGPGVAIFPQRVLPTHHGKRRRNGST